MSKLVPTIGIETHVQLKTKTKLFSGVDNDARNAEPNSLISHIDVGLPGALPVLNEKAVELACRAAFALNTKPQTFSKFDRKHYFYPDLPKGYQITQYEQPIILGGYVELPSGTKVGITRVHLEEDAGKNTHPAGADYSLVDLNRAGTPLLEIVSEPDIRSAVDAKAYARELWLTVRYAGVTDGDLYHGHVRFDVNVSLSPDAGRLGVRTEIKNLNSFRSVETAIDYEIKRQSEELAKGNPVIQETRGWDEAKQKTISQRGKEGAHDYRYMPDPDIPPLELDDANTSKIKDRMPMLPVDYRAAFGELNLSADIIEELIMPSPHTADLVYKIIKKYGVGHARRLSTWLIHTHELLNKNILKPTSKPISEEKIVELSEMVENHIITSRSGREVWLEMFQTGKNPQAIAKEKGFLQLSDEAEIERIVDQVISDNTKVVEDIKAGQEKAIGFLVGQVMAASKGAANPEITQKLIKQKLGI